MSDKHIVQKSGILANLLPGDIVMADRGFRIDEDVAFYQAKLVIPDFTRGKKQLHPLEVENTRKIANVRIHVERVIGLVVRKFRVFDGEIPLEFLKAKAKARRGGTDNRQGGEGVLCTDVSLPICRSLRLGEPNCT